MFDKSRTNTRTPKKIVKTPELSGSHIAAHLLRQSSLRTPCDGGRLNILS